MSPSAPCTRTCSPRLCKAIYNASLAFKCLLSPFQWNHPILSILPDELLPLLDSPVPVLLGLNLPAITVSAQRLPERHPGILFVDLDSASLLNPSALPACP